MLVTMKEILDIASKENYAVAAPNVFSELDTRAYIEAAEELNSPIIINILNGHNPDLSMMANIACELARQTFVPVAVNLDHGGPKNEIISAIRAGFTSVMIDRSALSFEENAAQTKEIVDIAHAVGVSVEAEFGHVGQADNAEVDTKKSLTSPQEAKEFVEATGVDCLAVAIGTAHGSYPRGFTPYLDVERLIEIKKALNGLPLVLHGSSGADPEDLRKVCANGINKVNVANDLCKAVVKTLKEADLEGGKAYDVWYVARSAAKEKLKYFMNIYGSTNKAWKKEPQGIISEAKDRDFFEK